MPRVVHKRVGQYVHDEEKRLNNPPIGLVTSETDHLNGNKTYEFDSHLDPELQWSGKSEGDSFDVDTVSLHVHERIDPITIIEAIRKRLPKDQQTLFGYFDLDENNPPIREAIEFYKHAQGWSNRLIAGDSLLVMNSLLEKESLAGNIQMIYIDPPYGIKYGSNFQPFVNRKTVQDGKDEDLSQEPETIKAFRDTWELGIHSYLTYLRNRLLLTRKLLSDSGSCFVQIGEENVHLVRNLMDEVFKPNNFISQISVYKTTTPRALLDNNLYYLIWYAKDKNSIKYHQPFMNKPVDQWTRETKGGSWGVTINGNDRPLTPEEKANTNLLPEGAEVYQLSGLTSAGASSTKPSFVFNDKTYYAGEGSHWKTSVQGLDKLVELGRIEVRGDKPWFKKYHKDFPLKRLTNVWPDTSGKATERIYVVQTQDKVIERCVLMTTDPGDLVFDPTCGSGTTAFVSEQNGRRWITCDTSRVAITLAKQRLMTSTFDYLELSHPKDGVSGGFMYTKIPHITLGSLAKEEPLQEAVLYDAPIVDKTRKRVSGPFTVEAVPSLRVRSLEEAEPAPREADVNISREGETLKQSEWIDEMLSSGIRGKNGQILEFARIEPLGGTRWLHADAETKDGKRAAISFGPEYSPLEQRQVELAIEEAQDLVPKPKLVIFASFQFDPEAAKDIDELKWPGVDILKVQMNTDLLTSDLKKKRASNESYWLVGRPDVQLEKDGGYYQVVVNGFDYYNTKTGGVESGDSSKIAMWELDTDYDGRSIYPKQVFFPIPGPNDGWTKLARSLRAEVDESLLEKYRGTRSLPFALGENKQIAVKIVDDRGIESLRIVKVRE